MIACIVSMAAPDKPSPGDRLGAPATAFGWCCLLRSPDARSKSYLWEFLPKPDRVVVSPAGSSLEDSQLALLQGLLAEFFCDAGISPAGVAFAAVTLPKGIRIMSRARADCDGLRSLLARQSVH